MEKIYFNYKDIQFFIKCSTAKAKELIYSHLNNEEKKKIDNTPDKVKLNHLIDIEVVDLRVSSPLSLIDNEKLLPLHVEDIRRNWVYSTIRKECIEDTSNIIKGGIYGKFTTLKKILSKDEIIETENIIKRRKTEYLKSGNKIPKSLRKYA